MHGPVLCSPGPPPAAQDPHLLQTSSPLSPPLPLLRSPAPLCSRESGLHAAFLMQTLGKVMQCPVTVSWVLFSFFPKNLLRPICFFDQALLLCSQPPFPGYKCRHQTAPILWGIQQQLPCTKKTYSIPFNLSFTPSPISPLILAQQVNSLKACGEVP